MLLKNDKLFLKKCTHSILFLFTISDPDIVSGDGIYTRYLGHYLDAGRYRFNILVDDNENNAFYVLEDKNSATRTSEQLSKMEKANNSVNMTEINYGDLYYTISAKRKCCGSTVSSSLDLDKSPSKVERTGIFRRSVLGPVIHLKNPSKASEDNVPPSRIGDLKIRQLPGASTPDRLMAEWTAPGGNFDEGSVASYRFVFSSKIEDLLQADPSQGQPEVLLGFDRIERAGTAAKFDFNFPHYDKDFYVGAYGFDIAGNRGKISNLVHVRVAAPKYVKSKEAEPIKSTPAAESMEIDWIVIGSICGVIAVLFIMAVLCIAYCIVVSRKKSKPVIMMTGYESPPDVKLVKELGGILTNKVSECTVLITDKIRRTSKFLCALGLGIPIVSPNWLVQSKMTKTFLGNYYLLLLFFFLNYGIL